MHMRGLLPFSINLVLFLRHHVAGDFSVTQAVVDVTATIEQKNSLEDSCSSTRKTNRCTL